MPLLTYFGVQQLVNTSQLRKNGRRFADNIFKCNFMNENVFDFYFGDALPKALINNFAALV